MSHAAKEKQRKWYYRIPIGTKANKIMPKKCVLWKIKRKLNNIYACTNKYSCAHARKLMMSRHENVTARAPQIEVKKNCSLFCMFWHVDRCHQLPQSRIPFQETKSKSRNKTKNKIKSQKKGREKENELPHRDVSTSVVCICVNCKENTPAVLSRKEINNAKKTGISK